MLTPVKLQPNAPLNKTVLLRDRKRHTARAPRNFVKIFDNFLSTFFIGGG